MQLCGAGFTSELFYVGRNVDADRAYDMGLVNSVTEPEELERAAVELAAEIGGNSPMPLRGNKEIMRTLRAAEIALPEEGGAAAGAPARVVLHVRRLRRGNPRLRRKAPAALARTLTAAALVAEH